MQIDQTNVIARRIGLGCLEWAKEVLDGDELEIWFARINVDRLSIGPWLVVGMPRVEFAPSEFAAADSERFQLSWRLEIVSGSGRFQETPEDALGVCWVPIQKLLNDLVSETPPLVGNSYEMLPRRIDNDAVWGESADNLGQSIVIFEIEINARGWD